MKLNRIEIENLLGIKALDVELYVPVLLVAGRNRQGKTSIAECVRLALLGETPRGDKPGACSASVNDGAKIGSVMLTLNGNQSASTSIASGKAEHVHPWDDDPPEALAYCLDPHRFIEADANARRAFLFRLMKLELTPAAIAKRLTERGCEPSKIDAIAPLLRQGFDSAAKEAAKYSTEAKGAWRGVTGETWGSKKGESWRASVPVFSEAEAAELHAIDKAIADLQAQLGEANKRLGIAEHAASQAEKHASTLAHLREAAKAFAHHEDLVQRAQKDLEQYRASLLAAQQKAGQAPVQMPEKLECPFCNSSLAIVDGKLHAYPATRVVERDPEAAAKIPELQEAVRLTETVLARHTANRDAADQAAKQLHAIEDMTPAPAPNLEPMADTVATLQDALNAKRIRKSALQADQASAEAAAKRTKEAAKHHADVLEWGAIAEALSPAGIPAELLRSALGPINDRLAQSAEDTDWPPIRIGEDMAVEWTSGRPYRLLSKSEKWRVDAMIGEAIAHLSGLRVLVLDEFDILDLDGRGEALSWLDLLATYGDIESAIVLGTLKQRPSRLPDTMRAIWIEKGAIVPEREEVAA